MKKMLLLCLALVLAGCAHVRPVVVYTCMGCRALTASGLCSQFTLAEPGDVVVPQCKAGEVLVVENWDQVSRKGAAPVLKCEKP